MDIVKAKQQLDELEARILKKDGTYRKNALDSDIKMHQELTSMMDIRSDELDQATLTPKPKIVPAVGSATAKAMKDPNFAWDVR